MPPLFFVTRARKIVKKFSFRHSWLVFHDVIVLQAPGNARRSRKEVAHIAAVGIKRLVLVGEHAPEVQAVSFLERLFEQWRIHAEADEVMVALRRISALRYFDHIESELRFDVSQGIIFVRHARSKFFPNLRIQHRFRAVGPQLVPLRVRRVMGHGAESEGVPI